MDETDQTGAPTLSPFGLQLPPEEEPRPLPLWAKVLVVLVIVLSAIGTAGFLIHVPYSTISPGSAVSLTNLVRVDGANTFAEPRGDIRLLFVRERNHVNLWRYLVAKLDDDTDVFKDKTLNPQGKSQAGLQQEAVDQMTVAKLDAAKVALEAAGYKVPATVIVQSTVPGLPAEKVLRANDTILEADGVAIKGDADLRAQISRHKAGEQVALEIMRDKVNLTVQVTVGESEGRRVIGVNLAPPKFDFPVKVSIDTAGIGGPSGGLAMTLAILDDLTPGDITGGKRVAVTGTIDSDGNVGEIGGIEQKAVAARAAHAQLFIVPQCSPQDPPEFLTACQKDLAKATKRVGSSVKVIPVLTFDDALRVLRENGGELVQKTAPGSARAS